MEAWLAELEMDMGKDVIIGIDHPQTYHHHQSGETKEATSFNEQLGVTMGLDFDYTCLIEPFQSYTTNNNSNNDIVVGELVSSNPLQPGASTIGGPLPQDQLQHDHDQDQQQQGAGNVGSSKKRKREPNQVMDHIMAERKRRELLSRLFIALSAIVPGLKKTDKTSVLGAAIKYLNQLQAKVKVLEEVAAKRTIESVVVVKKSQLVVDDESVDDDGSSCTMDLPTGGGAGGGSGGGCGSGGDLSNESLPEIEVRVSDKTILFRICCEKQKGTLPNLFSEIEKFDHLTVVSCSVIPFGSLALDITMVLQKEEGFDKNVTELVRTLRAALLFAASQWTQWT